MDMTCQKYLSMMSVGYWQQDSTLPKGSEYLCVIRLLFQTYTMVLEMTSDIRAISLLSGLNTNFNSLLNSTLNAQN